MDLATVQDVVDRWRPLTTDELGLAVALLGDASAIVRAQYPGIDSEIAGGSVDAGNVATVVAGMVKRAMILGDNAGVASETETAGPFSLSRAYRSSTEELGMTDTDALLILGYRPAGMSIPYGC